MRCISEMKMIAIHKVCKSICEALQDERNYTINIGCGRMHICCINTVFSALEFFNPLIVSKTNCKILFL